jgi:gluconolactonase
MAAADRALEYGLTMRLFAALALGCLAIQAQSFSGYKVEKAAAGFHFTEGPAWSHDGFLLFSDVPANRIHKLTLGSGTTVARENSNGASGNAFDSQGRLYTCETHTRRVVRLDKKGKADTLAERWEGKRLNAPNDIVVRKDGHVYFTDPAFGSQADTRELDFYGIFHITPKGELDLVAKWKSRPNGITLSPNGRILYVTDSDKRSVAAFDLDRQGNASNERVLIARTMGVPGGIRTDEKGNLYLACKGLAVYSPEGVQLGFIEMSETPSNLAFGDGDMQSIFITARTSVYRVRLEAKGSVQN